LPFPTKIKKEGAGAPFGNSNNQSEFPPKARVDTPAGASDNVANGDQAERGQSQDSGQNNGGNQ